MNKLFIISQLTCLNFLVVLISLMLHNNISIMTKDGKLSPIWANTHSKLELLYPSMVSTNNTIIIQWVQTYVL